MVDERRRTRLVAVSAAALFLAVALGIRWLTGSLLDSTGALEQYSGTGLYASVVYAGVLFLRPRTGPLPAGVAAVAFCWLIEFLQLTGIPAELSARSVIARLALGMQFDAVDLAWYPIGVLPLVALHLWLARRRSPRVVKDVVKDRDDGVPR